MASHLTTDPCRTHRAGDGSQWALDGNGIPLCRVCPRCRATKMAAFRPVVLRPYTAMDVDEPIEAEA